MIARLTLAIAALVMPFAASADAPVGLQHQVVFTAYTPLAGNAERMRRLLSPLTSARLRQQLLQAHRPPGGQSVDLSRERFALYVPATAPPQGYGLLVFVPSWEDARMPQPWLSALNRRGVIFVSAARAGKDADVFNRREPLALLAAYNVMQRYKVDPRRVYVGGFSGGSRVALRLALAYPDVFRGALLEAGSDPIGSDEIPLPPADLMQRFQDSRLVYLTGTEDTLHLAQDARSRDSLQTWCVFDVDVETLRGAGHDVADGAGFGRGLGALEKHATPDPDRQSDCRQRTRQALDSQLRDARMLLEQGRPAEARELLERIDARYGGLAAPASTELMRKMESSGEASPGTAHSN
ncbi:MAG TPA: PHB depolymerase family esterase, partial [Rhodanobacteraceae bacterium]|nr:PHB depolymerase family esterase [Rhodanobacteraceae bacterium]